MKKTTCPMCNGKKDYRAEMCKPCAFKYKHPRLGTGKYEKGKSINVSGYIVLNNETKQYEHRKIMEDYLGRKLLRNEHVHHIDENKMNNNIDNLMLLTSSEHGKQHMTSEVAKKLSIKGHAERWGV